MPYLSRSLLTCLVLGGSVAWGGWTQEGPGTVAFDAKGPAGFKIRGEANKISVSDDGNVLQISVKLEDVDTGISLRNRHLREDAHAKDFPTVTLSVPSDSIVETGAPVEALGTFEINGQKKEVRFTYAPKCAGGSCEIEGSAKLNLGDFGIKPRSYLGITVKSDITVSGKFKLKK